MSKGKKINFSKNWYCDNRMTLFKNLHMAIYNPIEFYLKNLERKPTHSNLAIWRFFEGYPFITTPIFRKKYFQTFSPDISSNPKSAWDCKKIHNYYKYWFCLLFGTLSHIWNFVWALIWLFLTQHPPPQKWIKTRTTGKLEMLGTHVLETWCTVAQATNTSR